MTRPQLNNDETGYVSGPESLLARTFHHAMNFHFPEGLAAVRDADGAYHINVEGESAYVTRFQDNAGFYGGLAAVRARDGWYHVNTRGEPAYPRRFSWAGNFQDGLCVVLSPDGFHHIDAKGEDAYGERHAYAGDFRDGIAVARRADGAFHICRNGSLLNGRRFLNAEPFHKGFAVVRDERGYFHVDRSGRDIHGVRFSTAEPFYNGYALCTFPDGMLVRVRPNGTWSRVQHDTPVLTPAAVRKHLECGARVGLILRHSERPPIDPQDPTWGTQVLLTTRGIERARRLGMALAGPWTAAFRASTVERCVQTARAVAEGAGAVTAQVVPSEELAGGPFFDGTKAHEPHMRSDYHALMTRYLGDGEAPGMPPMSEACGVLVRLLEEDLAQAHMAVHISHDLMCAVLMDHLGVKAPTSNAWCDYLEGACVVRRGAELSYARFVDDGATA